MKETNDKKETQIIVNGRPREVEEHKISYEQIVILAFGQFDPNPNAVYTVTYSRGKGDTGSLVAGDTITIKQGMVFNVTRTDKS